MTLSRGRTTIIRSQNPITPGLSQSIIVTLHSVSSPFNLEPLTDIKLTKKSLSGVQFSSYFTSIEIFFSF